jgi:phospholipase C
MTCRQWVDEGQIACTAWTDMVSARCTSWRDEGYSACDEWADEGSNQCSSWADEGHNECQSQYWSDCHWYSPWNCVAGWLCDAWYWVANWVCQGWYWVADWVCKGWYWVANLVCQAFVYVSRAVCLVWSWVAKLVCVAWDGTRCLLVGWFGRARGDSMRIKHVFVLMLENRAFDHLLGLSGVSGTDIDTGARRAINGAAGSNTFGGVTVAPSVEADFKLNHPPDVDPGHEFANTLAALCGLGAIYPLGGGPYPPIDNSGFIANYAQSAGGPPADPTKIMKCYSPKRVPIIDSLAREFALCDAWFSSLPGPTWPNRFFMHAASSGGLDDSPSGLASFWNTLFDGYKFNHGTIFDRLDDACIEWRVFAGDSFPVTLALSGMTLNELQGRIHDFDDFAGAINDSGYSAAYTFIEPNYGNDLPPSAEDFTCGNSQHPLDDITRGEKLIKNVYETIRNSPHWNDSLLLVTYDEHGGFYDHVAPPPATPPGDGPSDPDNVVNHFRFDQCGVRVPAVVISPFIERNVVDGTQYDHTTLLATVEGLFGLRSLTARDAAASNLFKLLTRTQPRTDAPSTLGQAAVSGFICDGDPAAASSISQGLTGSGVNLPPRKPPGTVGADAPIGGTMRGFKEVALLKALKNAHGRHRQQIRKEYLAADNHAGARRFIHKVAVFTRGNRPPAPRRAGPFRVLLSFRPRHWTAEPVNAYRGRPAAPPPP